MLKVLLIRNAMMYFNRAQINALLKGNQAMSKEVVRTVLYVLMGVLQTISIVLSSISSDREVQDIITVLKSLITLIQDALDNQAMWVD